MAKAGRKRKSVIREPNGRISRMVMRDIDARPPAAVKRLFDAAVRGFADPVYGSVLGQLYAQDKLTAEQFEAGKRWSRLFALYLSATQAPLPYPKAIAIGFSDKSADVDPDTFEGQMEARKHQQIVQSMTEAHAVLSIRGMLVENAMRRLCEGVGQLPAGKVEMDRALEGLNALSNFWELTREADNVRNGA